MFPNIFVKSLKMGVNPADNSYMPLVIKVSGGHSVSSLMELNIIYVKNSDTSVTLLSNMEEVGSSFASKIYKSVTNYVLAKANCMNKTIF